MNHTIDLDGRGQPDIASSCYLARKIEFPACISIEFLYPAISPRLAESTNFFNCSHAIAHLNPALDICILFNLIMDRVLPKIPKKASEPTV